MILHSSGGGAIAIAAAAGTVACCGYSILCLWGAASFRREKKSPPASEPISTPPVSILKPLKGSDPEMYASLRSHCVQDYPRYEIIFGVSEADDPAIGVVERLKGEFPERAIRLIHCREKLGPNIKISNLIQMLPEARHGILVVNDSDIQVGGEYLRRIVAELQNAGLVTCLYRGVPGGTLGSRLESLGISTDFCAGVLAARALEGGVRFGLGSTLAFRRSDLAAIGGFEPLLEYLADDYELGRRFAEAGKSVTLSHEVVDTHLPGYSPGEFATHQLRWARTIRHARPGGYVGMLSTFTLPWAALAVIAAGGAAWSWWLLAAAAGFRIAVAIASGKRVLRDKRVLPGLWLIPLRDLVALVIWAGGFLGGRVVWRGESFELKKGKLVRAG